MCNYIYTTDGKYIKQKIYEQFDNNKSNLIVRERAKLFSSRLMFSREHECTNVLLSQYKSDHPNELIPYDSIGNPQLNINKCSDGCKSIINNKPLSSIYNATSKNSYLYNNCADTCRKYCISSATVPDNIPTMKTCNICDKLNEMSCNYKIVNETCPDLCKDWMKNEDNSNKDEFIPEEDIFAETICKKIKEQGTTCTNSIYNVCNK